MENLIVIVDAVLLKHGIRPPQDEKQPAQPTPDDIRSGREYLSKLSELPL